MGRRLSVVSFDGWSFERMFIDVLPRRALSWGRHQAPKTPGLLASVPHFIRDLVAHS